MKRILVLLAIATVGTAASVSAAQAEVITNDMASISFAGFVPCANGGAGEILSGRIDVHNVVTSTVNDNHTSDRFQFRVTGVTQGTSTGSVQNGHYTLTYVNNFRLIGPGPGNNLLVHETAHITIDGDDVIVQHDNLSIECT